MTDSPDATAREVLAELEEVLASKNLEQMTELFTDDAVLIGDSVENFDRESIVAYLRIMAEMSPTVRWTWDRLAAFRSSPSALSLVAVGSIAFIDEAGEPLGEAEPFRLTGLAVEEGGRWVWRQFHGSAPRQE